MIKVLRLTSITCAFLSMVTIGVLSSQGVEIPPTAPHPYHVSYAEVAFNSETGNFEVALCVWPTDLEKAIRVQEDKPIDLEKTKGLDPMIAKYISRRFFVRPFSEGPTKKPSEITGDSNPTPHRASNELDTTPEQGLKQLIGGERKPTDKKDSNASENTAPAPPATSETSASPPAPSKKQSINGIPAGSASTASNSSETDQTAHAKAKSPIRWVGHELESRNVWLYFEVKGGDKATDVIDWTLENRVFLELNEDQLNHVQWSLNRQKYETFVCNRQKIRHRISTKRLLQKK